MTVIRSYLVIMVSEQKKDRLPVFSAQDGLSICHIW